MTTAHSASALPDAVNLSKSALAAVKSHNNKTSDAYEAYMSGIR